MKSKLVMLVSIGALAFGASVPSAMAASRSNRSSARGPVSVSKSARSAMAKKSASKTALPTSHTILIGAKNNF